MQLLDDPPMKRDLIWKRMVLSEVRLVVKDHLLASPP